MFMNSDAEQERPGPLALILLAACVGLGTGLLELVVQACRWSYDPATGLGDHLVNRHHLWMTPLAIMLVFAAFGLVLGLLRRTWPNANAGGRLVLFLLGCLVAFELLLVVPGLYTLTYVLLACGIASLTARVIKAQTASACRWARRAFPWLLGVLAVLVCVSYGRELYFEHRGAKKPSGCGAGRRSQRDPGRAGHGPR